MLDVSLCAVELEEFVALAFVFCGTCGRFIGWNFRDA